REKFTPLKSTVGMYCCGPTVYNYMHIGNLRSFLFEDILRRTIQFNKFKVKQVMNITDVGHLSGENEGDADSGEDKMLKGAKREGKSVSEIAKFYTEAFIKDTEKMNLLPPTTLCKATEHIKEQIAMIRKLEKGGYTYFSGGNVYFDTKTAADYGKLALLKLDAEVKSRVEADTHKRNPSDFVLWFTKSKFQEQEMKWDSPWGKGYPGWHIECSAMATKYLGKQFDIHCGGIDHIPVHHTNEIAQSESANGKKPWVKYWLHNEFLVLEGQKMAKSGGNFITLSTLEEKGFDPLDYRYLCLGAHYRKQLMFSYESLQGAQIARKKLMDKLSVLSASGKKHPAKIKKYLASFTKEINDDLNTPKALAVLWETLKDDSLEDIDKISLILEFDKVLGLNLKPIKKEKTSIPEEVKDLAELRQLARINKDWKKADELREKIKELGYIVG
ncbi:MAG: cysteine--tRNA ligase, partial [Nanoarchaeota archaeon]